MQKEASEYPMRINKYLAHKGFATRRGADALIEANKVTINGRKAVLGDHVVETDDVRVRGNERTYHYYAYHKPRGVVTFSPTHDEPDAVSESGLEGVFPVGRLDKASSGLLLLTDDGRITDRLLNPLKEHEKEYTVTVREDIPSFAEKRLEAGIDTGDYVTKPCSVTVKDKHTFTIILKEGKKHQIRRMCDALGMTIQSLTRIRIMNIRLSPLKPNAHRPIENNELSIFLQSLGL